MDTTNASDWISCLVEDESIMPQLSFDSIATADGDGRSIIPPPEMDRLVSSKKGVVCAKEIFNSPEEFAIFEPFQDAKVLQFFHVAAVCILTAVVYTTVGIFMATGCSIMAMVVMGMAAVYHVLVTAFEAWSGTKSKI
jgi:hypothetical protein